jgi:uncharacterized Tic20 family protein
MTDPDPTPQPASQPSPQPTPSSPPKRTWEVLCHLSALAGLTGIPFANIIGPLIVWLLKRNESESVDTHGKESLNFQISMSIYTIAAALTLLVAIGFVLLPIVILANLILVIIAAIKTSNGEPYRYPFTIRLIN